jgi:hypothetical protein
MKYQACCMSEGEVKMCIQKQSHACQYMERSNVMELRHLASNHKQKSSQCDIKLQTRHTGH